MFLVNGKPAKMLPLTDRAIQFGDGVFRTMRKEKGKILFWDEQYQKLKHDAEVIQIVCPEKALLEADLAELRLRDAAVKIILSRGNSIRGYAPAVDAKATRIVQENTLPETYAHLLTDGVRIRFAEWRLSAHPKLAGIKHLNRLDNVMARLEHTDAEIFESLMLDQEGWVTEGTMSNVFALKNAILFTPDLRYGGVAGVMRDKVIAAAKKLGIAVIILPLTPENILEADELILTNSLFGVVPVRECDLQVWADFSLCYALHQAIFSPNDPSEF